MTTSVLTTDRNKTGHTLEQYVDDRDGIRVLSGYVNSKNFTRITFKKFSHCWVTVEMDKIKNNRRTSEGISIDKKQLETLIENLSELVKQIEY